MKKIICIFLTVVMFAAAFTVTALAAEPEFEYKISVTDAQGKTVTDFGSLEKGDTVSVGVSLNRTDISDSYTAYGVEMTLTAKGLEYGSGEVFSGGSLVKRCTERVKYRNCQIFLLRFLPGGNGVFKQLPGGKMHIYSDRP